jgi:hypothetical protein
VAGQQPGEVFADYVKEQLELEDKRRTSLESRGVGVVTVSGTLVTLLFGISAVVTRAADFAPSAGAKERLSWALIAFAASSVIAIGTTVPIAITAVDAGQLMTEIRTRWGGTVDAALKATTATRVADLASLQRANSVKSLLLLAAVTVQVAAVLLLAWAVTALLR